MRGDDDEWWFGVGLVVWAEDGAVTGSVSFSGRSGHPQARAEFGWGDDGDVARTNPAVARMNPAVPDELRDWLVALARSLEARLSHDGLLQGRFETSTRSRGVRPSLSGTRASQGAACSNASKAATRPSAAA